MEWTDVGFVVDRGAFRESDVWLHVCFERHGLRTVYAFGGARSRHRFVGCLDVLNVLRCRVKVARAGGHLDLQEAVLERGPRGLRTSPRLLGVAMNCARFADALGVPETSGPQACRLLVETLAALDGGGPVPEPFPSLFQISLATILGFAPDFGRCGGCGAAFGGAGPGAARFLVDEGHPLCPACVARAAREAGAPFTAGIPLMGPALDALRRVQQDYPLCWETGGLTPADRRAVARVAGAFTRFHLGLAWERGRYTRA